MSIFGSESDLGLSSKFAPAHFNHTSGLTGASDPPKHRSTTWSDSLLTPPPLPPAQPQCSGQPVRSERERKRVCVPIVQHGSCFPVQLNLEQQAPVSPHRIHPSRTDGGDPRILLPCSGKPVPSCRSQCHAVASRPSRYRWSIEQRLFPPPLCWIVLGGHEWSLENKKLLLPEQLKLHVCFSSAFERTFCNPPAW